MSFKKKLRKVFNIVKVRNRQKIFCIGQNKTGTTSLRQAFKELGFVVGKQRKAEELLPYYLERNFQPIIQYCKSAQVFQDFPFSFPETYVKIDRAFPGSKFILSIRDSPEQWYNSYVKFYKRLSRVKSDTYHEGMSITDALKSSTYIYEGWLWEFHKSRFNVQENAPFPKEHMMDSYAKYNEEVMDYFQARPGDLLVINLSSALDFKKFINFLDVKSNLDGFPWEKKS